MAIQPSPLVHSDDTRNKQYLIRSAMLYNMRPVFDKKMDTLYLQGITSSSVDNMDKKAVQVSISGGLMPKSIAHKSKHMLHSVYNATASRFKHDEHGYEGIILYNIPERYNIDEPVGDRTDPEAYVRDMLTVMRQSGNKQEAQLADIYVDMMFNNFRQVISQIESSNWPDREVISQNLYNYCKMLQTSMQGQKSAQQQGQNAAAEDQPVQLRGE